MVKSIPRPIVVGDRVFLRTKSGYVDPTPWRIDKISDYGIELVQRDLRKHMTLGEFRKYQQPELMVSWEEN